MNLLANNIDVGLILIIAVAVIIVLIISYYVLFKVKAKRCIEKFNDCEWDYVLSREKFLIKRCAKRRRENAVYYMLGVSAFERGDDEKFIGYLSKLSGGEFINTAFFFLSAYYLSKEDSENYSVWKGKLKSTKVKENKSEYLRELDFLAALKSGKKLVSDPIFDCITSSRLRELFALD